jgi:phosphonate transport system substrate-binding protein
MAAEPIRFALTPVLLTSDLNLLELFKASLEVGAGRPVQLVTRRTYQEITNLLVSGQVDGAWICGYPTRRSRTSRRISRASRRTALLPDNYSSRTKRR